MEVTTCAPVETTSELVERRFYTWTAPYEQIGDLVHQITDLFGIAVAGEGGTQVMGLGFPDQIIIWDATASSSTTRVLLEEQSPALPLRTQDLANGFDSSLALWRTSDRRRSCSPNWNLWSPTTHRFNPCGINRVDLGV